MRADMGARLPGRSDGAGNGVVTARPGRAPNLAWGVSRSLTLWPSLT